MEELQKKLEEDMKELNMIVEFIDIMENNEVGYKGFRELLKWFVMVYEVSNNDEDLKDVFDKTKKAKKFFEAVNAIALFAETEVE
jgi:hypothetical protein|nr:MAG TPA: hypothetical protein [Caudoviricetes sp.]